MAGLSANGDGANAAIPGINGRIAFETYRDGNYEIYAMQSDGSNPTNLTNRPSSTDFHPVWSPDGTQIAFVSDRDGQFNTEIYVMNADGSNQTRLTNNEAADRDPSWSPDGSKSPGWLAVTGTGKST
jgi:Tol biopolymer transport system component